MITVCLNYHQMNHATVNVVEVWRHKDDDDDGELILSIPLESDEIVRVVSDNILVQGGKNGEAVGVLQ